MENKFYTSLKNDLSSLKENGTYKKLRFLKSPMSNRPLVDGFGQTIMLCSNNYLGLTNKPEIINAGIKALKKYGAGAASVRFICGTFDIHRKLEEKIAEFLNTEAALTYTSCMDANMSVIPAMLKQEDTVISDELNHASIIDGCRLICGGVKKLVYKHSDLNSLEEKLKESGNKGNKLIVTDGVFSMEGDIAILPGILKLAKKYNCIVMVDDSHGIGVIGKTGRGVTEYYNLLGKVDIITGTLGKALGGAGGGFVAAKKEVIDTCIQKSRSHLFSNSLPPVLAAIGIEAIKYLDCHPNIVSSLHKKIVYLHNLFVVSLEDKLKNAGIKLLDGESAIVPIIIGNTAKAVKIASDMLKEGVYVVGFGYPIVPEGKARIRLQVSDSLEYGDIDYALKILFKVLNKNVT